MIERIRGRWQQFKESEPGHRFQDRYSRRRRSGRGGFWRVFNIAGGIALALAGVIMVLIPGPGWATFFVGLWMIAGESLPVARFMDRVEVVARRLARRARNAWKRSPIAVKVLVVLAILACIAAVCYGAYYVVFGGSNG